MADRRPNDSSGVRGFDRCQPSCRNCIFQLPQLEEQTVPYYGEACEYTYRVLGCWIDEGCPNVNTRLISLPSDNAHQLLNGWGSTQSLCNPGSLSFRDSGLGIPEQIIKNKKKVPANHMNNSRAPRLMGRSCDLRITLI